MTPNNRRPTPATVVVGASAAALLLLLLLLLLDGLQIISVQTGIVIAMLPIAISALVFAICAYRETIGRPPAADIDGLDVPLVDAKSSFGLKIEEMMISSEERPLKSPPTVGGDERRMPDSAIIKDGGHCIMLHDWLSEDDSDGEFTLLYRGSRDGLSNKAFRSMCANKGRTITVIKTTCGTVVGGYSAASWSWNAGWRASNKAFLFALSGGGISSPCKMKLWNADDPHAICNNPSYGPIFGSGYDMFVDNDFTLRLHHYPDGSYIPGPLTKGSYTIDEMEVFQITMVPPIAIGVPLGDAELSSGLIYTSAALNKLMMREENSTPKLVEQQLKEPEGGLANIVAFLGHATSETGFHWEYKGGMNDDDDNVGTAKEQLFAISNPSTNSIEDDLEAAFAAPELDLPVGEQESGRLIIMTQQPVDLSDDVFREVPISAHLDDQKDDIRIVPLRGNCEGKTVPSQTISSTLTGHKHQKNMGDSSTNKSNSAHHITSKSSATIPAAPSSTPGGSNKTDQRNTAMSSNDKTLQTREDDVVLDIWVDPDNGNDENSGLTREQALQRLTKACERMPIRNALTKGVKINLVAGNYCETIVPECLVGILGTDKAPIVFCAADDDGSARLPPINVLSCSHVHFEGLDFSGAGRSILHFERSAFIRLKKVSVRSIALVTGQGGQQVKETVEFKDCHRVCINECNFFGEDIVMYTSCNFSTVIKNELRSERIQSQSIGATIPCLSRKTDLLTKRSSAGKEKETKKKAKNAFTENRRIELGRHIPMPSENDIKYGRGTIYKEIPANKRFRELAKALLPWYVETISNGKGPSPNPVISKLIELVKEGGGRFLTKGPDGKWYEIEEGERDKVGEAMRYILRHTDEGKDIQNKAPKAHEGKDGLKLGTYDTDWIMGLDIVKEILGHNKITEKKSPASSITNSDPAGSAVRGKSERSSIYEERGRYDKAVEGRSNERSGVTSPIPHGSSADSVVVNGLGIGEGDEFVKQFLDFSPADWSGETWASRSPVSQSSDDSYRTEYAASEGKATGGIGEFSRGMSTTTDDEEEEEDRGHDDVVVAARGGREGSEVASAVALDDLPFDIMDQTIDEMYVPMDDEEAW